MNTSIYRSPLPRSPSPNTQPQYLIQVRPASRLPPDDRPVGFLFRAEECPPSRHVTTAPGHAFTAATFRRISRRPPAPASAASAATSADGSGGEDGADAAETLRVTLPAITALHVLPLPSSLTPEAEARLVAEAGHRVFPPLPCLPQGPACPPSASGAEVAEADGGANGTHDAGATNHDEPSPGSGSSGNSFPFPLPPTLEMDDEDTALLGRLFA